MTDESPPSGEPPAPWKLQPSLTEERFTAAARLLARGRAEAGRVECFWPVPLDDSPEAPRNSGGFLQLPLSAGVKAASRPGSARKRADPKGAAQEPGFLEGASPIG